MISKGLRSFAAVAGWLVAGAALANRYNLQEPQSVIARQIYDLHTDIMWIIVGIFIVVFGTMTYSIVMHRKSVGHKAAQFHEHVGVEIAWTVVPFISFFATLSTPREQIEDYEHKGTQKGEHYLIEVDNPVVVPVGKKVRIITTANDVIHAWWVPQLGIKQDAIPGFVRDTWFKADNPGTYRGQCAELCGKDHGFMPIVVEVVTADKYAAWVADQKKKIVAAAPDPGKQWTMEELKAQGEKVYGSVCAACHQANGMGMAGNFPALSGSKVVNGPKEEQIKVVLNGRKGGFTPNSMMPPQANLSDVDIAAAITYTRNSWANKTGEMVTPAEVKAARK